MATLGALLSGKFITFPIKLIHTQAGWVFKRTWDPFHKSFFQRNSNLLEISFCSHPSGSEVIAMKFCIWHDSSAVVACAKFCSDMITNNWVTVKQYARICGPKLDIRERINNYIPHNMVGCNFLSMLPYLLQANNYDTFPSVLRSN